MDIRSSSIRSTLAITLLAVTTTLISACSTYDSTSRRLVQSITPYRINIVQGNFVSREAAAQLREGMTRDQVKFLLGTPLLTDVFHADRWDYIFSFKRGSTAVVQERRYTVFFEGDKLVKFKGDEDLPSEYELIAEIDGIKAGRASKISALPSNPAPVPAAVEPTAAPVPAAAGAAPAAPAPAASTGAQVSPVASPSVTGTPTPANPAAATADAAK